MSFVLPELPYAYDALEPHIDTLTMQIHHSKHHQAYITNLNNAIAGTDLADCSLDDLLKVAGSNPAVRNNGGGHWNHSFFWGILSPQGGGEPDGELGAAINASFGSFAAFKEAFTKAIEHREVLKKQTGGRGKFADIMFEIGPADEEWLKENKDRDLCKNGFIFAHGEEASTKAEAKEKATTKSKTEPLEQKTTGEVTKA